MGFNGVTAGLIKKSQKDLFRFVRMDQMNPPAADEFGRIKKGLCVP